MLTPIVTYPQAYHQVPHPLFLVIFPSLIPQPVAKLSVHSVQPVKEKAMV